MKASSHGTVLPWEPGPHLLSSSRHTTELWTRTYLPAKWRHRFASYADDIAAGADTLEELFELLKALVECFDKAGIQVKASKLIFGVREISFHT
jgi:hypothetical protein